MMRRTPEVTAVGLDLTTVETRSVFPVRASVTAGTRGSRDPTIVGPIGIGGRTPAVRPCHPGGGRRRVRPAVRARRAVGEIGRGNRRASHRRRAQW